MQLDSKGFKVLKQLIKEYGGGITLDEILSKQEKPPIEEVTFTLKGYYDNAYELTGDEFERSGTIADFFSNEFYHKLKTKETGIPLTDALSESDITELAVIS